MKSMRRFDVYGMNCAACSARVESAVSSLEGIDSCTVNLLSGSMTVEGDASDSSIISAVEKAGYDASVKTSVDSKNANNNLQKERTTGAKTRLIASVAILVPLMYLSMGYVMWDAPLPDFIAQSPLVVALMQMVMSAAVLVINRGFFIRGFKGVIHRAPNMDTLVALGSAASFLYSSVAVFTIGASELSGNLQGAFHGLHDLYFEAAAMILTLITVGKLLEERAKIRTADAISALVALAPKTATVIRDGREQLVPAAEVAVGEIFIVRPGESIPVDGVVLDGVSAVNEAALTGESIPVDKQKGSKVLAATINGNGALRCEATAVGDSTAIATVIRMVEDATSTKAPISRVADRVAGIFVPCVLGIALITTCVWWIIGGDFGHALARGVAVLVISCPCALGLATPVAITVGSGVAARLGILFKNAEAIELTAAAQVVALDKTGTVTMGEPRVTDVLPADEVEIYELLSSAASVESMSEHPLARAVMEYSKDKIEISEVTDFCALTGSGVYARLGDDEVYGGSLGFISEKINLPSVAAGNAERLSAEGKTPLLFLRGGKYIGMLAVADGIRADSADAVRELRNMGLRVVMLTGDNERTARAIGAAAGIDDVRAGLLPDEKAHVVRSLAKDGKVIMVGDGINDAPALTSADVGVAIGGGTDIAIDSADVVLMHDSLSDVARAVRLGRAMLRNIKQNLAWAFGYNCLCIPLAAGVFTSLIGWEMSPMIGALAMSLSSVCVVSNALRLGRFYNKENTASLYESTAEKEEEKENMNGKITVIIEGMMCPHCEANVKRVLEALECVDTAEVSHKEGLAVVSPAGVCELNTELITSTIEGAGYKVVEIKKNA